MESIPDIKQKAKELRKNGQFKEAAELLRVLWNEHRSSCNEWDGWGYATCLRKLGYSDKALEVCRALYQLKPDFKPGKDLYAWCVYDTVIKKDNDLIKKDERIFFKAATAILDLTKQDKYSPHTKTIFRAIDYLKTKQQYPAKDITDWLDKLDPDSLADEPFRFMDDSGKQREKQSDKEKWFSYKTKCLEKLGFHKECIIQCEKALNSITKFHFDNDIWLKRRIALSRAQLGDKKGCAKDLENILKVKKEWFIQHDLASIYLDLGLEEKALNFAVEAALNSGKAENKWRLFLLIAKLLESQGRIEDAKSHVLLAANVRVDRQWSIPEELENKISEYNLDISKSVGRPETLRKLKKFWISEKQSCLPKMDGTIKVILPHGKAGFISGVDGRDYYFNVAEFKGNKKELRRGTNVSFFIENSYNKKKKVQSKIAIDIQKQ